MRIALPLSGGQFSQHFGQLGIAVSVGHSGEDPLEMVKEFLAGSTQQRENPCAGFEHRYRHRHCRGQKK